MVLATIPTVWRFLVAGQRAVYRSHHRLQCCRCNFAPVSVSHYRSHYHALHRFSIVSRTVQAPCPPWRPPHSRCCRCNFARVSVSTPYAGCTSYFGKSRRYFDEHPSYFQKRFMFFRDGSRTFGDASCFRRRTAAPSATSLGGRLYAGVSDLPPLYGFPLSPLGLYPAVRLPCGRRFLACPTSTIRSCLPASRSWSTPSMSWVVTRVAQKPVPRRRAVDEP